MKRPSKVFGIGHLLFFGAKLDVTEVYLSSVKLSDHSGTYFGSFRTTQSDLLHYGDIFGICVFAEDGSVLTLENCSITSVDKLGFSYSFYGEMLDA